MLGRAVTANPYLVSEVDEVMNRHFLSTAAAPAPPSPTRLEALRQYGHYLTAPAKHCVQGSIRTLIAPVMQLFRNCSNAKSYKRLLTEDLEATTRARHTGPVAAGDIVLRVCDQLSDISFEHHHIKK